MRFGRRCWLAGQERHSQVQARVRAIHSRSAEESFGGTGGQPLGGGAAHETIGWLSDCCGDVCRMDSVGADEWLREEAEGGGRSRGTGKESTKTATGRTTSPKCRPARRTTSGKSTIVSQYRS